MLYTIANKISGLRLGTYTAPTSDAALDAQARDAGYANRADMLSVIGGDGSDISVEQTEIIVYVAPDTLGTDAAYPEAFARYAEERLATIYAGAEITVEIGEGCDSVPDGDERVMQDLWDSYCGLTNHDYEILALAVPEDRRAGYLTGIE